MKCNKLTKEEAHNRIQIGEVFSDHYCYGDGSISFYQVVRKTPKKIIFKEIEKNGDHDYPLIPITIKEENCRELMLGVSSVDENNLIYMKRPYTNYMRQQIIEENI